MFTNKPVTSEEVYLVVDAMYNITVTLTKTRMSFRTTWRHRRPYHCCRKAPDGEPYPTATRSWRGRGWSNTGA